MIAVVCDVIPAWATQIVIDPLSYCRSSEFAAPAASDVMPALPHDVPSLGASSLDCPGARVSSTALGPFPGRHGGSLADRFRMSVALPVSVDGQGVTTECVTKNVHALDKNRP